MSAAVPLVFVAALAVAGAIGAAATWWLHRRTALSVVNVYLTWLAAVAVQAAAISTQRAAVILPALAVLAGATVAAALGRRWHRSALGAGGELRAYEQQRVMAWRRDRARREGERVWIADQGELVRERAWPTRVPALPMTGDGRGLIPLGEGHHLYFVGATGSGKTTSARRWLMARGLAEEHTALLALDPKGDPGLEHDLRAVAKRRRRPFIVFDPFDVDTERWNPIWADEPGAVVARLVAPVEADADSDASHYSRVLRVHLAVVADALHAAGQWPISLPALLRYAQRERFSEIAAIADAHATDPELLARVDDHKAALKVKVTQSQLDGSLLALAVVAGQSWRRVLTPDGDLGAITLPAAMAAGAVVLWRTHVEDIKEEAETITTLALADIAAAALTLPEHAQWALLIDEFGSVLQGRAGDRAIALMQRARSSHGQVAVSTQSVSDVAAATGNEQLLAALTDNFTGFILHRQTSPESRDWLAMLLGTRELWQSTDRTVGGGRIEGTGSRRRAAEFLVRPDEFKLLPPGGAVVWTTLGPSPERIIVTPAPAIDDPEPPAASDTVYRPVLTNLAGGVTAAAESQGTGDADAEDLDEASTPTSENADSSATGSEAEDDTAPAALDLEDFHKPDASPPAEVTHGGMYGGEEGSP